jgi:hypothetical protein
MIQLYRLVKNMKFLPCTFALLFSLLGLSTVTPSIYAATDAVPSVFSSNWSGFEATGPLNTFRKSQCTTTVPKVTTSGDVSVWCGLGGDPTSINPNNPTQGAQKAVLVQAGIDACLNSASCIGNNCQPGVQCNSAWWEIADALVVQPIRFTKGIHVGDVVYVYMQSNLHDDGIDLFYLQNRTTGEAHKISITNQGATKDGNSIRIVGPQPNRIPIISDGASVECIVERPLDASSNTFIRLATFQSTTVTGCDDGRVNQPLLEPIASAPSISKINMFNGSNQQATTQGVTVLAQPTSLFGTLQDSFNVIQPPKNQQQTLRKASIVQFITHKPG